MDFQALPALSLPLLVQDALIAVGAGVALLASLIFINLGVLLPGLLTSLGRPEPDQRGAYLEFGPAGAPVISDPAPSRTAPPETDVAPRQVARSNLWGSSPGAPSRI
jgi:hypothetical protein